LTLLVTVTWLIGALAARSTMVWFADLKC